MFIHERLRMLGKLVRLRKQLFQNNMELCEEKKHSRLSKPSRPSEP